MRKRLSIFPVLLATQLFSPVANAAPAPSGNTSVEIMTSGNRSDVHALSIEPHSTLIVRQGDDGTTVISQGPGKPVRRIHIPRRINGTFRLPD